MNLSSWDYYDLEKEMQEASMFQLLELFKREEKKYINKCSEYMKHKGMLDEREKQSLEKECELLEGSRIKVTLKITDVLTK